MVTLLPALLPNLKTLYEDLHAHPELSFAEHRTASLLAGRLRKIGYEVTTGVGRTGVVAVLRNGAGPTVLMRADIDGLPVKEDTGLPYASRAKGIDPAGKEVPVAHACGHDMHATWLMGVAHMLAERRKTWSGTALLVLQPAEELGAGALAMIEDKFFERFGTPVVALGQHVAPMPAGQLFMRAGPVMAAADGVRIVLYGRGGHASMPEQCIDPIVMAASVIMKLQTVVSRQIAPADTAVVSIGTVHAGSKENIIPDRAELTLSIRTYDAAIRERVLEAIRRIVKGEANAAGATKEPEVTSMYGFPAVDNDAEATRRVSDAFVAKFGKRVLPAPVVMGSEDFGIFGKRGGFPYVFWFVGGADPVSFAAAEKAGRITQDIPSNHSPHYAPVANPTITTGVEAMMAAALVWLGK
jgi:hippurate hydrolase